MNEENLTNPTNSTLKQSITKIEEQREISAKADFVIPEIEKTYETYFKRITKLQAGDIIRRPNCKLCQSDLRGEAEQKWEYTKGMSGRGSIKQVVDFLNSKSETVVYSCQNISLHMQNHYEQQQKRLWLREYGERLSEIMNYKLHKEQMFEALIQSLQAKFFEISANPELDIYKQSDAMTKISKSVLDVIMTQAKLRGDVDTVDLYKEKFQNIIVNFISGEKDVNRQKELISQLDRAREEISDEG